MPSARSGKPTLSSANTSGPSEYDYAVSASTVGRITHRYDLYFTPPVRPKSHPYRRTNIQRQRKPSSLKPTKSGDLVAIDVVSKRAAVHVSTNISTKQGELAWRKAVRKLGLSKAVLTANGSENLGAFAELLKTQQEPHYLARPYTPKDKPYVERFIGTLEREYLQWSGVVLDVADQQATIDA